MLFLILSLVAQLPATPVHCGTGLFHELTVTNPEPRVAVPKPPTEPVRLGEERVIWLWDMTVMPPTQYQADATVRGIGDHCYVVVEDSAWDVGLMDSTMVARIIDRFDNSSPADSTRGVWDHNTTALGDPPDEIDNDSLVYLLFYNIGTFHGSVFDGFWMSFDEYYDSTSMRRWGYHSNEIECVYLDCHPNDPSSDYRIAIAAHEFAHMIHWNYDQAESLWVNEGCAELVMQLFGAPDPISAFPGQPDNDLTRWTGAWADYIKTYLFFLFLNEQYADLGATDLIREVVASPAISIDGIDEALAANGISERFDEVFDHWVLTNVINDTAVLGGNYGYYGDDVPRFNNAAVHQTYPVSRNGSLNRWAGEYIYFGNGTNLELEFDGADAAQFRAFIVGKDTIGGRAMIDTIELDSQQHGYGYVPGFDTSWQIVWLAPANHTPTGQMSYSYSATASGIAERPQAGVRFAAGPSIIRAGAELEVPGRLQLADASGRVVAVGDGRLATAGLNPGVYFVSGENRAAGVRLLVIE